MTLDYESVQPIVLDFFAEENIDLFLVIPESIGVKTNTVYLVGNSLGTKIQFTQIDIEHYKTLLIARSLSTDTYHIECQADYGVYRSDNFDVTVYKPNPVTPVPSDDGYFYYGTTPKDTSRVWVDPRDLDE